MPIKMKARKVSPDLIQYAQKADFALVSLDKKEQKTGNSQENIRVNVIKAQILFSTLFKFVVFVGKIDFIKFIRLSEGNLIDISTSL
jgi:hypothetical protein